MCPPLREVRMGDLTTVAPLLLLVASVILVVLRIVLVTIQIRRESRREREK